MKKTLSVILAVLLAVSLLAACGGSSKGAAETKYETFTFNDLTFKVPENLSLKESSIEGYDYYLEGDHVIILATEISKELLAEFDYSIDDIKEIAFQDIDTAPEKIGNTETASYHNSVEDSSFFYTYSFVESANNVYDVHLACAASEESQYKDIMYDIISKIEVAK